MWGEIELLNAAYVNILPGQATDNLAEEKGVPPKWAAPPWSDARTSFQNIRPGVAITYLWAALQCYWPHASTR